MTALVAILKAWGAGLRHFLATPAGRALAVLGVAALVLILTYRAGFKAGVEREVTAQALREEAARKTSAKVEKVGKAITAAVDQQSAARKVEIRTITKTLIEKVPVYVTVEADRRVDVPVGFVRLHDQAATGLPGLPDAPGLMVDAPSGVPLSAVAGTVVGNYGVAYEWREEALGCRAWVAQQEALWRAMVPTPSQ
ncbi:hypothetical protein [Caulobacter endophyticus]|uniref:Uncharacterized protein n=1 Tax=Caulobacter endophyticus TaxID=2172652 RepID=A0A2T9K3T9_9CAUL|nr:hypothetical protein [Caulobacter endophyticus]PVM90648.1 hypothetical protein DDF67_09460 [Caulobacter endophyticus]